jgi:ABC-type dipeptide/oligopeptide/nickel transport system ATPase component
VGESGCGKSVTAHVDPAADARSETGRIASAAQIKFEGEELTTLSDQEMLAPARSSQIGMIFQDPMSSV